MRLESARRLGVVQAAAAGFQSVTVNLLGFGESLVLVA
jgi:hypothetical protein